MTYEATSIILKIFFVEVDQNTALIYPYLFQALQGYDMFFKKLKMPLMKKERITLIKDAILSNFKILLPIPN